MRITNNCWIIIFSYLQSEAPSESEMNNLGIYLLFSFSFVMAALIELFVLVILSGNLRSHDDTGSANVVRPDENNDRKCQKEGITLTSLISRIDKWAFWVFNIGFVLFNCGYWMKCLTNQK